MTDSKSFVALGGYRTNSGKKVQFELVVVVDQSSSGCQFYVSYEAEYGKYIGSFKFAHDADGD